MMHSSELSRLMNMLVYKRPAGSPADVAFCDRYLSPLGATRDNHGNYHVVIGDAPVLWSAHTDTVHHESGIQRVRCIDGTLTSDGDCLGADDTAGIFILCELIKRRVPGHYVFHYAEERGGIGSRALADEMPDWLVDMRYAIAFDRGGFSDVITHQLGRRTASDAFANELADVFNAHPQLVMLPSDNGIYTDTESYAGIIPECTNVSVGYHGAHSPKETLDVLHVSALLDALTDIDVTRLPVERVPSADEFTFTDWPVEDDDREHTIELNWRDCIEWRDDWRDDDRLLDARDSSYWLTQTQAEIQQLLRDRIRGRK